METVLCIYIFRCSITEITVFCQEIIYWK